MPLKKRLRTILLCAALECGVLSGVPMRPEEIRALMDQINQPKLAHVMPAEDEDGDDPPDILSTADVMSLVPVAADRFESEAQQIAIHPESSSRAD